MKIEAHAGLILDAYKATPDITVPRSRSARYGGSSHDAGSRAKKTAHATEQDRSEILKRREEWFDVQLDLDPEQLIFIDETWA